MSQSNKRSFEPRRSEYRPLNSSQQRPPQARPAQPRPQPGSQRPYQGAPQQRPAPQARPARPAPQARPARPAPYRQESRPAYAPRREKAGLPYGFGKILIACVVLVAACIALQFVFPNGMYITVNGLDGYAFITDDCKVDKYGYHFSRFPIGAYTMKFIDRAKIMALFAEDDYKLPPLEGPHAGKIFRYGVLLAIIAIIVAVIIVKRMKR